MNTVALTESADPAQIRRYVSASGDTHIKLLPRACYITDGTDWLTTLLGSCVALCLRDPKTGVGGMNHYMLPNGPRGDKARAAVPDLAYGQCAIDYLIEHVCAAAGITSRPKRLEAKVFGGANVFAEIRAFPVGDANAAFARRYLASLGIPIVAEDLGGRWPREVRYRVDTGQARVRRLPVAGGELAVNERRIAALADATRATPGVAR